MRRIEIAIVVGVLVLGASACAEPSTHAAEAGAGTGASSASPTHAAEAGEPDLIQVEGFVYEPVPGEMDADLDERVAGMSSIYASASQHGVFTQFGGDVGLLTLYDITPEGQDLVDPDPKAFIAAGTDASAWDAVTISGEDVWTFEREGVVVFAWYDGKTVGALGGEHPGVAEAFVTAYLAEANGQG